MAKRSSGAQRHARTRLQHARLQRRWPAGPPPVAGGNGGGGCRRVTLTRRLRVAGCSTVGLSAKSSTACVTCSPCVSVAPPLARARARVQRAAPLAPVRVGGKDNTYRVSFYLYPRYSRGRSPPRARRTSNAHGGAASPCPGCAADLAGTRRGRVLPGRGQERRGDHGGAQALGVHVPRALRRGAARAMLASRRAACAGREWPRVAGA